MQGQAEDRSIKMTTAESLAVFFILDEAREKHGFTREEYGLSAAEASIIAHVFTKYAPLGSITLLGLPVCMFILARSCLMFDYWFRF